MKISVIVPSLQPMVARSHCRFSVDGVPASRKQPPLFRLVEVEVDDSLPAVSRFVAF